MKRINLTEGDFNSRDALEILTAYIHVEICLYHRKMETEIDQKVLIRYEDSIRRLQKILFEACAYVEKRNGTVRLISLVEIS
jgi:hypothetical protein